MEKSCEVRSEMRHDEECDIGVLKHDNPDALLSATEAQVKVGPSLS